MFTERKFVFFNVPLIGLGVFILNPDTQPLTKRMNNDKIVKIKMPECD